MSKSNPDPEQPMAQVAADLAASREPELSGNLRTTVQQHALFAPGQTIVVGISGGPDSTALLHALAAGRAEWELSLVACHLNHGFRGAEADADAEYVRTLCADLKVDCRVGMVDVPALQKRRHWSAQAAARDARHRFLRQCAATVGAERIALAHTRDDRVESILLNLLRGSGLEGLAGFSPVNLPLVRPLYNTTRAQVEAYCAHYALNPRHDSSNTKISYRRNRVRLELLPILRARFNPKADDALLRIADLAREDNAYLEQCAAEALDRLLSPAESDESDKITASGTPSGMPGTLNTLSLPLDAFQALPPALQRRVLRQAILRVRGHLQDVGYDLIEKFIKKFVIGQGVYGEELPAAGTATVRVFRDQKHIAIFKERARASALAWQVTLNLPGRTVIPQANVALTLFLCRLADIPYLLNVWQQPVERTNSVQPVEISAGRHTHVAVWERTRVLLPLAARAWRPGDRMRMRGLQGSKKIQDIFTDAKIPLSARSHVPLLTEDMGQGRILAVADWRVDETALFTTALPCDPNTLTEWIRQQSRTIQITQELQELQELIMAVWEYE